jgi:murein DD-endopeptidase MepM/ murein hydrolase activator NlpD
MRDPRFPARRSLAAAVAVCVMAAPFAVGLAGAQDDDVDDLRQEREDNRRDAAQVASELDELAAEDEELAAAIDALDAHIGLQETKIAAAEEAIADARARAAAARAQAEVLADDMVSIRLRLEIAAIDAFVAPRPDALAQLDSENLLDVELRRSYVEQVVGDEYELIDELRSSQAAQDEAIRRADDATAEAEAEESALEDRLAELDVSRAEVENLRAQVSVRIEEWQAVGLEIEAADAAIGKQIRELEAALARQAAEAARIAAEDEASRLADAESADGEDPAKPPLVLGPFSVTHRPVPGAVTSLFGPRIHPIFGTSRSHFGIDMHGNTGDPIAAAAAGQVITAGWMSGYGNTVIISHGDGVTTLYAHQSEVLVGYGDMVDGGDAIGKVGSTGFSTGPHLHWEIRVEGVAVDPLPYL